MTQTNVTFHHLEMPHYVLCNKLNELGKYIERYCTILNCSEFKQFHNFLTHQLVSKSGLAKKKTGPRSYFGYLSLFKLLQPITLCSLSNAIKNGQPTSNAVLCNMLRAGNSSSLIKSEDNSRPKVYRFHFFPPSCADHWHGKHEVMCRRRHGSDSDVRHRISWRALQLCAI